jgi:hypothetical protein
MKFQKTVLSTAMLAVLGTAGSMAVVSNASAAVVADGNYNMVILTTPTSVFMTSTINLVGSDGAWNSTFTFGTLPGGGSQGMTDNGTLVTGSDSGVRGSSMAGDSLAGVLGISVSGGSFSVSSFSVDAIFATAGGTFVQYGTITGSGSIDQTSGAMSFTPTLRLGAISAPSVFFDNAWNIDDAVPPCSSVTGCASNGNTTWSSFTTGSSSNASGTINGAAIVAIGDVNGDSVTDYAAILVSASAVGTQWGGFASVPYVETWSVQLLSQPTTVIPIPAAAWLFGSGLLGLAAVARRKKKA